MAHSFETDLTTLALMADNLHPYLLSDQPAWPLGGRAPQLTLGQLWLTRQRLTAAPEAVRQRAAPLEHALDTELNRWPAHAERQAAHEAHMRLNLWRAYLNDDERTSLTHYRTDVTHRVLLALLGQRYPAVLATPDLAALEAGWRARFAPGPFVWDAALQAAFPAETFWFLYGLPHAPK